LIHRLEPGGLVNGSKGKKMGKIPKGGPTVVWPRKASKGGGKLPKRKREKYTWRQPANMSKEKERTNTSDNLEIVCRTDSKVQSKGKRRKLGKFARGGAESI